MVHVVRSYGSRSRPGDVCCRGLKCSREILRLMFVLSFVRSPETHCSSPRSEHVRRSDNVTNDSLCVTTVCKCVCFELGSCNCVSIKRYVRCCVQEDSILRSKCVFVRCKLF